MLMVKRRLYGKKVQDSWSQLPFRLYPRAGGAIHMSQLMPHQALRPSNNTPNLKADELSFSVTSLYATPIKDTKPNVQAEISGFHYHLW